MECAKENTTTYACATALYRNFIFSLIIFFVMKLKYINININLILIYYPAAGGSFKR